MTTAVPTFALLELLATLVPDPLELRAELFHLEGLQSIHLLFLLQQLLLLARLPLLTRLLAGCVLSSNERVEVTRMASNLCRSSVVA